MHMMAPAASSSPTPAAASSRALRRWRRLLTAAALLVVALPTTTATVTPNPSRKDTLLASLLGPIPGASQFFEAFWQQKPAVIRRHNPTFYQPVIRSTDLDTVLAFSQEGWKLVKRVKGKDGEWWSSSPPRDDDGDDDDDLVASALRRVERAHGAFAQGFSLVVDRMDEKHDGVGRLVAAVEAEVGHRVGANVYWTPGGGSQAFEAHFDWMVRAHVRLDRRAVARVCPNSIASH